MPSNDLISGAVSVTINAVAVTEGTTAEATADVQCTDGRFTVDGVWYAFVGAGRLTTVSTCEDETEATVSFQLKTGATSSCVGEAYPDLTPTCTNALGSAKTFDAAAGTTYYALAHGVNDVGTPNHAISVVDYTPPPNDQLGNAISMTMNGPTVTGVTTYATKDVQCSDGRVLKNGVW